MNDLKVLALLGGISSNSLTKRLYNEIVKHNPTSLVFQTFDLSSMPYFSQDIENNPPENVVSFQNAVRNADAVLFITPEYNRSYPGVLKNAIDWCSRPPGHNLWSRKPAAIMGASPGKIGSFGAQQHLKHVCAFLDMDVMNQPEFYLESSTAMNENGIVPQSLGFVQNYIRSFAEWIGRR
jgi:chromate reductase